VQADRHTGPLTITISAAPPVLVAGPWAELRIADGGGAAHTGSIRAGSPPSALMAACRAVCAHGLVQGTSRGARTGGEHPLTSGTVGGTQEGSVLARSA
jgi:hypothetical protein